MVHSIALEFSDFECESSDLVEIARNGRAHIIDIDFVHYARMADGGHNGAQEIAGAMVPVDLQEYLERLETDT